MLSSQQFRIIDTQKHLSKEVRGVAPKTRPITPAKGQAPRRAIGKAWRSAVPHGKRTT
jgi:hypothetical protein